MNKKIITFMAMVLFLSAISYSADKALTRRDCIEIIKQKDEEIAKLKTELIEKAELLKQKDEEINRLKELCHKSEMDTSPPSGKKLGEDINELTKEIERASKEIIFKRVAKYIEGEKKATDDEISALEKDIAGCEEAIRRISKGIGNYTQQERKKAIETLKKGIIAYQEKVERLKNGQETVPPSLPYAKLAVGQIGSIKAPRMDEIFSYKIFQIIDDNNFLLEIRIRILDEPVEFSPFWIEGTSTTSLVDGMEYCPDGIFCVIGTKRYTTTTGGSKTVFALQPIDMESLKKEYENQIKK